MIIVKTENSIVCDMGGCKNKAKYFIKIEEDSIAFDNLKLCENCAKELFKALKKEFAKKEKDCENKAK